jgi:hypothetical protein
MQSGSQQLTSVRILSPKPYTLEIPFSEDSIQVKHESAQVRFLCIAPERSVSQASSRATPRRALLASMFSEGLVIGRRGRT